MPYKEFQVPGSKFQVPKASGKSTLFKGSKRKVKAKRKVPSFPIASNEAIGLAGSEFQVSVCGGMGMLCFATRHEVEMNDSHRIQRAAAGCLV